MELNEYLNYIDPAHANLCEYGDDDEHDDNEYTPDEHEAYEAQCMDDTIYWHEHNEHETVYMMHENDESAYYMGGRGPHTGKGKSKGKGSYKGLEASVAKGKGHDRPG